MLKRFFHGAPYIQYEQIKLNDNFRKCLESSLKSKIVLRTGAKPIPYQKRYKINKDIQSFIANFILQVLKLFN